MSSSRMFIRPIACALLLAGIAIPAAAAQRSDFGTLSIQVRPPDAEVYIDGERWQGPESTGPLLIQLLPGTHRVEMRAPGRQRFVSEVTIRAGETYPLNVSLTAGEGGAAPPQPPAERPAPPPASPSAPRSPMPPMPPSSGITQVHSSEDGFVFAPDFKVAEINHHTSQLMGAYAGYVFAGEVLIGAGGYWQLDSPDGTHLAYGGPVVEWRLLKDRMVGFNLHGLVGAGWRYLDYGHSYYGQPGHPMPYDTDPHHGMYGGYWHDEAFFVAEPEAQIVVRFGSSLRLQGGVGYRAASANGMSGVSGSIAVQFGR